MLLWVVLALAAPSPASAQQEGTAGSTLGQVTVPSELPQTPPDFSVAAGEAINIANRESKIKEIRASREGVEAAPTLAPGRWEIGFAAEGEGVALVYVDGSTGEVLELWTGDQVSWPMARGNPSQFGHLLNAPWVWIPLCLVFLLGLVDFKQPRRIGHLDLLVLLSFSVSHIFFNDAEIGVSVPLAYPPLLYLLGRVLWIGFKGPGSGLRPSVPILWLALAIVFLGGLRIATNFADSGVIDVGYAGVIGADRITHGEPVYGDDAFPSDNPTGDTYGPANYVAYIPFELALPWSGDWDELPAARTAAIFFDLATIAGLLLLGRRLMPGRSGRDLGVILAFAWVAFPYTAYAMQSNSNDSLVAALLVWSLVALGSIGKRAALLAFVSMVKFAPAALAPLYATGLTGLADRSRGRGSWRDRLIPVGYFSAVFAGVIVLLLLYPALDPGLGEMWDRTVGRQLQRESPFSIWGQVPALEPLKLALMAALVGLSVAVAWVPRRRTLTQVAALAAGIVIGTQLVLDHWFYLYIPWFFPLAMAAIAVRAGGRPAGAESAAVIRPSSDREATPSLR